MRIVANRLIFSKIWAAAYAAVILLNVTLLAWTAAEWNTPRDSARFRVFVATDLLLTAFLLAEIAILLVAQGPALYCSQCNHRTDCLVAVLCLVALALHAVGPSAELAVEEEAAAAVLVLRYSAQLLRLVTLVKNYRRQRHKSALNMHLSLVVEAGGGRRDAGEAGSSVVSEDPASPGWGGCGEQLCGRRGGRLDGDAEAGTAIENPMLLEGGAEERAATHGKCRGPARHGGRSGRRFPFGERALPDERASLRAEE